MPCSCKVVISMETNTRTQTNASNQLTTEGQLTLKGALDDLLYQTELIELSEHSRVALNFDYNNKRNYHGQRMYIEGIEFMAKAVREMLRKEVE